MSRQQSTLSGKKYYGLRSKYHLLYQISNFQHYVLYIIQNHRAHSYNNINNKILQTYCQQFSHLVESSLLSNILFCAVVLYCGSFYLTYNEYHQILYFGFPNIYIIVTFDSPTHLLPQSLQNPDGHGHKSAHAHTRAFEQIV